MLQLFIRFPEFAEFTEFLIHLGENYSPTAFPNPLLLFMGNIL